MNYTQKTISVSDLKPFPIRELRQDVLEKLRERIKERGYNVAKSLTIVKSDGDYLVADGNHRLSVLKQEGIKEVPCIVYEDADIYKLAIESNMDEDVYASMDLFDWLDVIRKLTGEGLTQQQIGDRIGWTRDKVQQYGELLKVESILDICKLHQMGRSANNVEPSTFKFTVGGVCTNPKHM